MNNISGITGNPKCETDIIKDCYSSDIDRRLISLFSMISLSSILRTFATKLGLKFGPFMQYNDNTYYFINGFRYKTYTVKQNPDILNYPVYNWEKGKSARELFDMALGKVSGKHSVYSKTHVSGQPNVYLKGE